jgi:hypothetical protein
MKILNIIILCYCLTGCATNKVCSSKPQNYNFSYLKNNKDMLCQNELTTCEMAKYKNEVQLEQCQKSNDWWKEALKNLATGVLGIISGYYLAK